MSSSGPRNPWDFFPRRSPCCENYEQFNNSNVENETHNDVFNPRMPPPEIFPERFHYSDSEDKFQGGQRRF
uniref:Uncharacterized protein n=1 Tax=Picea sitchensis TaxID=3332 RepID=A9P0X6_PICSI|nr:unknown [Picea sitchensis]